MSGLLGLICKELEEDLARNGDWDGWSKNVLRTPPSGLSTLLSQIPDNLTNGYYDGIDAKILSLKP